MGSRAEVVIAIDKKAYALSIIAGNIPLLLDADKAVSKAEDKAIYWHWPTIQWYYEDAKIKAVEDYLAGLEEIEVEGESYKETPYGLCRIGEELEDFETEGDPYLYDIYPVRTIEFPGDSQKAIT